GFVSTAVGDSNALHLLDTSPLIDAGNPALGGGESPTDADGNPRIVPGRAGANPVSDIGAFEFQPHPPTVTVSGPAGALRTGTAATFTATATDPDPGDSLSLAWHFDDGAIATGAHVSHAFARPGTHTATVTVTDLEGFTAMASAQAMVVSPPKRPAITKLTM